AIPVREPQGRRHDFAYRSDRRGAADRSAGWHRCTPPGRLLLRPDPADLGSPVCRGDPCRRPRRDHQSRRAMDGAVDGSEAVRLPAKPWYLVAALLTLAALVLPLGVAITYADHPPLLVVTIVAAALFVAAAFAFSMPLAFAGV